MATTPTPGQDPRTVVRISTRLWSDEVGRAIADDVVPPFDVVYKFSNDVEKVEKNHYQDTP